MRQFDGLAAHTDQVAAGWARQPQCPPGVSAEILASNDWSPVQALSVRVGGGDFWSVQYHPELSLGDIGRLMLLAVPRRLLVEQGTFASEAGVEEYAAQLIAIDADPTAHSDLRVRAAPYTRRTPEFQPFCPGPSLDPRGLR